MASFTDMIPTFNPYIQQLPVEEMAMVGMEKQRRYDEGIQKIQSQIDNIAGLDIARNVDRKYLQSRLNQMGNELRTVAAGDFSNFQLVNSTGGMINQVAKDRNITNAVRSTAKYRKAIENREKYLQDGKTAPSNDWLFGEEVNNWMTSEDLEAQFNGDYRPYVDWKANAREILKSINPDAIIEDNAFNADGTLSDAIIRTQFKGIRPEKIQAALMAGLTAADFQQMQIDGRYQYSNISPERFANSVNEDYNKQFDAISKKRSQLIGIINGEQDIKKVEELEKELESIDGFLDSVQKEYDNITETFESGDIESAKARLFTTNFMTTFSNAFSHSEVSATYEKSHFADMQMRRDQFNITIKQKEDHFWANYNLKLADLDIKERTFKAKYGDGNPMTLPSGLSLTDITKEKFLEVKEGREMQAKQLKVDLLASATKFTPDEILLYRKHLNGDSLTPEENRIVEGMNYSVNQLQERFSDNEIDPNSRLGGILNQLAATNKAIDQDNTLYNKIAAEADANPDLNPTEILRDFKNVNYKSVRGRELNFTPEEMIEGRARAYQFIRVKPNMGLEGAANYEFLDREAAANLNEKELAIFEVLKKKHSGGNLFSNESDMYRAIEGYTKEASSKYKKAIGDRDNYFNERLKQTLSAYQPVDNAIPFPNAAAKQAFSTSLLTFINTAENQTGALPGGKNTSPENLRDIASNLTSVMVTRATGNEYQEPMMRITIMGGKDKTNTASWDMDMESYMALTQGRFERSPLDRAFDPVASAIQRNDGPGSLIRTTAVDGSNVTTETNAFWSSGIDFPSIKTFSVKANVIESSTSPGYYSLEGVILNPATGKYTSSRDLYGTLLNKAQVIQFKNMINDEWVFKLLNRETATEADIENLRNKR